MLGGGPEEFSGYLDTELKKWARVIKSSGARVE
jgi:hypothetical protein